MISSKWLLIASVGLLLCGSASAAPPGTIGGRVVDAQSKPVEHISVSVFEGGTKLARVTFTNAQGRFIADRLKPDATYSVAVASPSLELVRKNNVRTGADIDLSVALSNLQGKVVAADGKPVVAKVTAISDDWALERSTKSDAGGRFLLRQLPPTIYMLRANSGGPRDKEISVDLSKPQKDVILKIEPTASSEIVVLEKTSHKPLANVEVNIGENIAGTLKFRYLGKTNELGRIIDRNAIAGTIHVKVASPLHQEPSVPANVSAGSGPHSITVYTDRSAELVANLQPYIDRPIKRVEVIAKPLSMAPMDDVGGYFGTFSANSFSIPVPPGKYSVTAIIEFVENSKSLRAGPRSAILLSDPISASAGRKTTVQLHRQK